MTPLPSQRSFALLSQVERQENVAPPELGQLDFLGRMPIPLRRPFKAGLDRVVAQQRSREKVALECCFLAGGEWYHPFDGLATAAASDLPAMVVSTLYHDILSPSFLAHYTPGGTVETSAHSHPSCLAAGLADPLGAFRTFATIPFVFLVDEKRLKGRPAPRCWADLLQPCWADDIVFGGWRPNDQVPYQDYNSYLLMALHQEYGSAGMEAFAGNVLHLQHNIRTAVQAGSNSRDVGTISVLPWLQAELSPRRERTKVIWPEDGALVMPIGYLVKPEAASRVAPLIDYVTGSEVGRILARNCYPPSSMSVENAFPPGVRLKWPGWDYVRSHDLAQESRCAAEIFFKAWQGRQLSGMRACS